MKTSDSKCIYRPSGDQAEPPPPFHLLIFLLICNQHRYLPIAQDQPKQQELAFHPLAKAPAMYFSGCLAGRGALSTTKLWIPWGIQSGTLEPDYHSSLLSSICGKKHFFPDIWMTKGHKSLLVGHAAKDRARFSSCIQGVWGPPRRPPDSPLSLQVAPRIWWRREEKAEQEVLALCQSPDGRGALMSCDVAAQTSSPSSPGQNYIYVIVVTHRNSCQNSNWNKTFLSASSAAALEVAWVFEFGGQETTTWKTVSYFIFDVIKTKKSPQTFLSLLCQHQHTNTAKILWKSLNNS